MATYIMDCLKAQIWIVFSWGFHSPIAIKNGLRFSVNGFIFKGIVEVVYNEGTDLFDIKLIKKNEVIITLQDVYIDELIEVIDNHVEKVDDYNQRVKKEYSI